MSPSSVVKNQLAVIHGPMSPGRITFVLVVATVIWAVLIALMFVLGFLICLLPSTLRNTLTELDSETLGFR